MLNKASAEGISILMDYCKLWKKTCQISRHDSKYDTLDQNLEEAWNRDWEETFGHCSFLRPGNVFSISIFSSSNTMSGNLIQ